MSCQSSMSYNMYAYCLFQVNLFLSIYFQEEKIIQQIEKSFEIFSQINVYVIALPWLFYKKKLSELYTDKCIWVKSFILYARSLNVIVFVILQSLSLLLSLNSNFVHWFKIQHSTHFIQRGDFCSFVFIVIVKPNVESEKSVFRCDVRVKKKMKKKKNRIQYSISCMEENFLWFLELLAEFKKCAHRWHFILKEFNNLINRYNCMFISSKYTLYIIQ